MKEADVPTDLIDLALTGAAPGCRDDAAFYLANVLPEVVQRVREQFVREVGQRIECEVDKSGLSDTGKAELLRHARNIREMFDGEEDPAPEPETTEPHQCDNCDGIDPASCVNAPTRRDLLRDLTREAVDAGTYGEPAPEMAPALRDRIADVLRATFDEWIVAEWICCEPPKPGFAHKLCRKGHAARHMVASLLADDHEQHPPTSPILDAVLPVVEAALAEQATRKESFQVRAERSAHDAECERVWNEYPKVIDALREQTQRAERVEALLRDLVAPDDCYFDHHGGCQAHGYLSLRPGEKCPHAEAKELLAALDQPEAPDHA